MVRVVYRYLFDRHGINMIPPNSSPAGTISRIVKPSVDIKLSNTKQAAFRVASHSKNISVTLQSRDTLNQIVFGYFVVPKNEPVPRNFEEIKQDLHILSPRLHTVSFGTSYRLTKNYTLKKQVHPLHHDKEIWVVDHIQNYDFEAEDLIMFFIISRGWDQISGARTGLQLEDFLNAAPQRESTPYLFSEPHLNPDYRGRCDPEFAGVHFISHEAALDDSAHTPITVFRCDDTRKDWNSDRDFDDVVFYVSPL